MSNHLMQTYARLPIQFTHGDGSFLFDRQGNSYLDAVGGVAVCSLGHAHPALTRTIAEQAGRLMHVSNLFEIPEQVALGDKLSELSGLENAFFCNSGAEANEAAIKLARLHGHHKGIELPKIIVADGSFHGRTLATLSATGNPKVHAGFEPLVQGFLRVPYGDVEAVQSLVAEREDIAAILVEPVQGEGGVVVPPQDYLIRLREICTKNNILLMLDEVQSGTGRTARWFAYQHNNIQPDVMTLAKGLGGGMPIGACLAGAVAASLFHPGNHGSTFGGNPLACAAAMTVVETIEQEKILAHVEITGQRLLKKLRQSLSGLDLVKDIRGAGLLIGIELNKPCGELVMKALNEYNILINVTAHNVIRLMPPLILTESEADQLAEAVTLLIQNYR